MWLTLYTFSFADELHCYANARQALLIKHVVRIINTSYKIFQENILVQKIYTKNVAHFSFRLYARRVIF